MAHTKYENHVRMIKDHTGVLEGVDGNIVDLSAGQVIDTHPNLHANQVQALINVGLATDNPEKHKIYQGSYDQDRGYYTPETVDFQGSLYKCIQDTPNPAGVFDETKWDCIVKGVDHVDPT